MKQFMNKRLHQKKKRKKRKEKKNKKTGLIIMPELTSTILMRQFENTIEY